MEVAIMATTKSTPHAGAKELMTEDMSFIEEYEGQGLDTITANEQSTAYLSIVQPGSQSESEDNPAGTWRNTATNENYGDAVRVVPIAFRTIWSERSSEPPFGTVGRYAPNSIQVTVQQPKSGRGYPKMINPDTGNEVQELYVYAVMLPDHPEAGVLYFNPTVGSMRACKSWNTQLKTSLLPNGAHAPIFGFTWNLHLELVQNPVKPTEKIARFTKVSKDSVVPKDLFMDNIKPQLDFISKEVLSITENIEASNDDN